MSSIKREIRHFAVVVVQWRQKSVQKKRDVALPIPKNCLFWRSRCRRPRGILKSLLFITFRQFLFAQIKLRFQIDCFPQWTLPVLGWYLRHLQSKGRELLKWRYVVKWVRCHTSREIHTTWKQTQRKHECHKLDGESQFKEDKDWNKIKVKERMAILNETQRWNSRSKILPREGSLLILHRSKLT